MTLHTHTQTHIQLQTQHQTTGLLMALTCEGNTVCGGCDAYIFYKSNFYRSLLLVALITCSRCYLDGGLLLLSSRSGFCYIVLCDCLRYYCSHLLLVVPMDAFMFLLHQRGAVLLSAWKMIFAPRMQPPEYLTRYAFHQRSLNFGCGFFFFFCFFRYPQKATFMHNMHHTVDGVRFFAPSFRFQCLTVV